MSLQETVGEVARNVKGLYTLDQSSWQERVRVLDSSGLLKELNRNRKFLNINQRVNQIEVLGGFGGLVISLGVGFREGMIGFGTLIFGSVPLHGRPGCVLDGRINFIKSELQTRTSQAIFYQDTTALDILDPLTP